MGRGYSGSGGRFRGRGYGGYGTTGDYGYGASGDYGESQFGGGAEEGPGRTAARRRLTPEEYWQRYFAPGNYEGRTRGDDTGDRFVPRDPRAAGARPRRSMRYVIEDLAAGHPAVRDVDNRIAVRRP